jgi:hypothetical protein
MTVERSDVGAVQDRLLAARSALAQATTREAMAAALMDECECMLDRQSLAQRARTDFATVRAARVLRGTLSPEHALQELRALENINVGALEALVDALPDDSLGALLRPPFGPGLVDARVVLEELYRRGRFDLVIELAPAGLRRPLLISWAELCARTTDEQRSAALRAADEAIARDSLVAPIQQPREQTARFLALRRLSDRALLEPPATRAPWIARLSEALDRDVAIALMYQSEGLLRARIAIARLECGELDAAMTDFAQVHTSASAVLSQSIYGAWDFDAALSALQRSLTPEALERVEDALLSTLEANVNVARHVWFSLAKRLRTTSSERAFSQAMRARSWGEWGDLYWLDEVPSNVCADAVARGVAALPALAEQHARGGRSWDELNAALREVPATGPWVEACAERVGAALLAAQNAPSYGVRFVLRWLFEAARRGSAAARTAILRVAEETFVPWHEELRWYRGIDDAFVDRLIAARAEANGPYPRSVWLMALTHLRTGDDPALRRGLAPIAPRLAGDSFLLKQIVAHVAPEQEHAVVCAALDGHSHGMTARWAEALLALAAHCSDPRLARVCVRRYLCNASPAQHDKPLLAWVLARVGDHPRVRAALAGAFAKRPVPAWLAPLPERAAWLRAFATREAFAASDYDALVIASNGLPEGDRSLPAALDALVRASVWPVSAQPLVALLKYAREDTLAEIIASFARVTENVTAWMELVAQAAERAPSLFADAMAGYDALSYAKREVPEVRWTKALIDRAAGDRDAIRRAMREVRMREFVAPFYRVVKAFGWMDELVDALLEVDDRAATTAFVWLGAPLLDERQLARMRPLFAAMALRERTRFDVERLAAWLDPMDAGRAWAARTIPPTIEWPPMRVVRALAGQEGVDRLCARVERELAALCARSGGA